MTDTPSSTHAKGNGSSENGGARALFRHSRTTIASGDMLDARRFEVRERVSDLFVVRVVAVSDNHDIDFEAVIGRAMSFTVHGAQSRTWTGICADLHQIGVEEQNLSTYELTLVPSLWLATQRKNHRMFQQMSEIDIAQKLLGEWGASPTLRLSGSYKKRKYRVQYGESDFAFVCRMLEDAGVSFYFDGEGQLVLDDGPQRNAPRAPIAFRDHPTHADLEHVTAVRVGRRLRPGAFTVRDHDYRRPPAFALVASASAGGGIEGRLECFQYAPGSFLFECDRGESTPQADDRGKYRTDEGEGAALARRRLDAERGGAREVSFQTNAYDLSPGTVLSFLDHPRSDLAPGKQLLVVASSFEGEIPGVWTCTCTAVSAEAPHRPARQTPRPKVSGVESATVVGPPGEEIHVDEFGRVRVHFHWDRESKMDDRSSCWIHVSQPWGGAGYGGINLPRVGQEVVVDFLGGDPDRPLIVGRVYTNIQKTPYKLPESKTQSGWKSNSTGGKGGYSEIMFEDRAGRELVRMQAEKDLHKLVKHDEEGTVGRDRRRRVGNDEAAEVGRDRRRKVGNDEAVEVGRDRRRKVGNDEAVEVGRDRRRAVGNDEAVEIGNDRSRSVGNDETVSVGGRRTRTVGGDERVTIGNDRTKVVSNDESVTIGNDHTRHVKNSESVTIGKDLMSMVMASAREVTALSKNVVVGVNRSTQIGLIDTVIVGKTHVTMVSPPGESAACLDVRPTRWVLNEDDQEIATTGGAALKLHDKQIVIDADTTPPPPPAPAAKGAPAAAPAEVKRATITLDQTHMVLDVEKTATATMLDKKITLDANKTATITLSDNKIELAVGKDNKITITDKEITIHGTVVNVTGKPINLNCEPTPKS